MTRKDYVRLASVVKSEFNLINWAGEVGGDKATAATQTTAIRNMADHLAASLAQDNPRFDRDRFLTACGVQP